MLISAIADFGRTLARPPVLISAIADFGRTLRATPGLNTNQTCNQHQHCANFYTHVTTLGGIYYIFYMPFTEIDKESH